MAERAIQELQNELLRQDPSDGYVSPLALSTATASLNSRIPSRGLSATEMWFQRDQFSNSQLPVDDRQLITSQYETRVKNHPYSETSKAPHGKMSPSPDLHIGDLVYLYADRDKSSARDRYFIVSVNGQWCNIQKFCGSQIRNTSYRVKRNECYKVPPAVQANPKRYLTDNLSNDEEELCLPSLSPPPPMTIPPEISTPLQKTSTPPTTQPEAEQELSLELEAQGVHELSEQGTSCQTDTPVIHPLQDEESDYNEQPLRRSSRSRRRPDRLKDYVIP